MMQPAREQASAGRTETARLDRWLWFARVAKSRTLAAGLVQEGKVRVNRAKVSRPSQPVRTGDVLTITVGPRVRVLKIVRMGARRGPATEARALYEELATSGDSRPDEAAG